MDTREELNKTVSEMNHIVKDIIKVAKMSNKEEESKILILSQLLNKTEDLIRYLEAPRQDLNLMIEQERRYIMLDVEERIRRMESDIFSQIHFLLEAERKQSGL